MFVHDHDIFQKSFPISRLVTVIYQLNDILAESESNKLKETEKIHAEKLATITTTAEKKAKADAARLAEHDERAAKLGSECAALRAELEVLGKHQKSSTGQCELDLTMLQKDCESWVINSYVTMLL